MSAALSICFQAAWRWAFMCCRGQYVDFDFIIHLKAEDVSCFAAHFSEGYYCDQDAIVDAIMTRSIFNIIDFESGCKADFVILKAELFRRTEFSRRRAVEFFGMKIWVVSAEDLFISKLSWVQESQSAMQMNDLSLLCELSDLDWSYIHYWIKDLSLNTFDLPMP